MPSDLGSVHRGLLLLSTSRISRHRWAQKDASGWNAEGRWVGSKAYCWSFVSKQVAAWIESQKESRTYGKRKHSATPSASTSLPGTSLTNSIYGSVVSPCIIISRPVIRRYHYFDESIGHHRWRKLVVSVCSPVTHAPYFWH
jgi:hypothetical protein